MSFFKYKLFLNTLVLLENLGFIFSGNFKNIYIYYFNLYNISIKKPIE